MLDFIAHNPLALPCGHVLQHDTLINATQFHNRFLRHNENIPVVQNHINISTEHSSHTNFSRAYILAQLEQYLPYYDTEPEIRQIFSDTMTQLHNAEIHPNTGMPATIAQKGRAFPHPSHNLLGGVEKT